MLFAVCKLKNRLSPWAAAVILDQFTRYRSAARKTGMRLHQLDSHLRAQLLLLLCHTLIKHDPAMHYTPAVLAHTVAL